MSAANATASVGGNELAIDSRASKQFQYKRKRTKTSSIEMP
jgi:hypothetical protein